jgi:glycosyltransferase involved in cell wall biosynthesis
MASAGVSSVAHVLWAGAIGGIERLVRDLAAEQSRSGLRVAVVFGRAEGPFADAVHETGVEVVDLGLASGYLLGPGAMRRGVRALRSVDVVHLHGFNLVFGALTTLSRRPVIYTEHGNFGLARPYSRGARTKRILLSAFLKRRTDAIAANSKWTARFVVKRYGVDPARVTVVYNGSKFPPLSPQLHRSNRIRVAFVGRLVASKRVDRVIAALAGTGGRNRVSLDIVGSGPLEGELRALARTLGVADRVAFHGYRFDVDSVLREIDVIVQPSTGEPFGLALVEGYAAGALPIVFADGGGTLEILPEDGIVVEDVDDLARTFETISNSAILSPEARTRRGDWARRAFGISTTADRYRRLYDAALMSRGHQRPSDEKSSRHRPNATSSE